MMWAIKYKARNGRWAICAGLGIHKTREKARKKLYSKVDGGQYLAYELSAKPVQVILKEVK